MAERTEGATVFEGKAACADTRNVVVAIDTNLSPEEIDEMIAVVESHHKEGDMIYLMHCTGKHDAHIGGHCRAAQEKEEAEARVWIKEKFESRMSELNYPYTVEIQHASADTEGIGMILSKRADALSAALVVMGRTHKNFLEKMFVGSVTEFVQKHTHTPVAAVKVEKDDKHAHLL